VLAAVVELDADKLRQMLPPVGVGMKHSPICLCGACYGESPCHKIEWQLKKTGGCDRHQLPLLSKYPACEKPFPIPALWTEGLCQKCFIPFAEMAKYQKAY